MDDEVCPLCCEPLEQADKSFLPCSCGYQVCMFCWQRIREIGNGSCPGCRSKYSDQPSFKPVPTTTPAASKSRGKAGAGAGPPLARSRSTGADPSKEHLKDVRVVQRNLVYVIGLSPGMAKEAVLRKQEYFGQYGKILKIAINKAIPVTSAAGTGTLMSASAYITFSKDNEARTAILSVDGFVHEGRLMRASYGTTKYCHSWLRDQACTMIDCLYLHDYGVPADSFTREEMLSSNAFGAVFQEVTQPKLPPDVAAALHKKVASQKGLVLPPPAPEDEDGMLALVEASESEADDVEALEAETSSTVNTSKAPVVLNDAAFPALSSQPLTRSASAETSSAPSGVWARLASAPPPAKVAPVTKLEVKTQPAISTHSVVPPTVESVKPAETTAIAAPKTAPAVTSLAHFPALPSDKASKKAKASKSTTSTAAATNTGSTQVIAAPVIESAVTESTKTVASNETAQPSSEDKPTIEKLAPVASKEEASADTVITGEVLLAPVVNDAVKFDDAPIVASLGPGLLPTPPPMVQTDALGLGSSLFPSVVTTPGTETDKSTTTPGVLLPPAHHSLLGLPTNPLSATSSQMRSPFDVSPVIGSSTDSLGVDISQFTRSVQPLGASMDPLGFSRLVTPPAAAASHSVFPSGFPSGVVSTPSNLSGFPALQSSLLPTFSHPQAHSMQYPLLGGGIPGMPLSDPTLAGTSLGLGIPSNNSISSSVASTSATSDLLAKLFTPPMQATPMNGSTPTAIASTANAMTSTATASTPASFPSRGQPGIAASPLPSSTRATAVRPPPGLGMPAQTVAPVPAPAPKTEDVSAQNWLKSLFPGASMTFDGNFGGPAIPSTAGISVAGLAPSVSHSLSDADVDERYQSTMQQLASMKLLPPGSATEAAWKEMSADLRHR